MGRPKQSAPETGEPGAATLSRHEAAVLAIEAGYLRPSQAVAWARETFGVEFTAPYFSAIKAAERMKAEGSRSEPDLEKAEPVPPEREPASELEPQPPVAAPAAVEVPAPTPAPQAADANTDLLEAITAIKPLVARYGADRVKRIADLLGQ